MLHDYPSPTLLLQVAQSHQDSPECVGDDSGPATTSLLQAAGEANCPWRHLNIAEDTVAVCRDITMVRADIMRCQRGHQVAFWVILVVLGMKLASCRSLSLTEQPLVMSRPTTMDIIMMV